MIHALYIINRNGGLIYHQQYSQTLAQLTTNDALILAGTLHGVHAISSQISPSGIAGGLESLSTEHFDLHIHQTLTGVKFVVLTDRRHRDVHVTLRTVYDLYADYVMKNPFYQTDMPIRCHLFDRHLNAYCARA